MLWTTAYKSYRWVMTRFQFISTGWEDGTIIVMHGASDAYCFVWVCYSLDHAPNLVYHARAYYLLPVPARYFFSFTSTTTSSLIPPLFTRHATIVSFLVLFIIVLERLSTVHIGVDYSNTIHGPGPFRTSSIEACNNTTSLARSTKGTGSQIGTISNEDCQPEYRIATRSKGAWKGGYEYIQHNSRVPSGYYMHCVGCVTLHGRLHYTEAAWYWKTHVQSCMQAGWSQRGKKKKECYWIERERSWS